MTDQDRSQFPHNTGAMYQEDGCPDTEEPCLSVVSEEHLRVGLYAENICGLLRHTFLHQTAGIEK